MNREHSIRQLQQTQFDVLIIGGGATGLGIAVDAASRGIKTALIEQSDFAKGTSSRSTKLIHGGVRYLEQGNISLVLDALKERKLLQKNAPNLVFSQPFVIPTDRWWKKFYYGIGLKIYDLLAGKSIFKKSKLLSKKVVINRIPNINQKAINGGVLYYDGQFDDARLAITLAKTASEQGAVLTNYTEAEEFIYEGDKIAGVQVIDNETSQTYSIKAQHVINATGPFVDKLRKIDQPTQDNIIAPSQGIHLVLPSKFLGNNNALLVPKTSDGRVIFAVPWKNRTIIGTTDTPIQTTSLEPDAQEEEKQFILDQITPYLETPPTPKDVLSIYVGIRPLVGSSDKNTALISRDHTIEISKKGLYTITGGKWTTYRKMAQDLLDTLIKNTQLKADKCKTKNLSLAATSNDSASEKTLHPNLEITETDIVWFIKNEMARTVEDILSRRTRSLILDATASVEVAPEITRIMANELNKDQSWSTNQTESFQELAKKYQFYS